MKTSPVGSKQGLSPPNMAALTISIEFMGCNTLQLYRLEGDTILNIQAPRLSRRCIIDCKSSCIHHVMRMMTGVAFPCFWVTGPLAFANVRGPRASRLKRPIQQLFCWMPFLKPLAFSAFQTHLEAEDCPGAQTCSQAPRSTAISEEEQDSTKCVPFSTLQGTTPDKM